MKNSNVFILFSQSVFLIPFLKAILTAQHATAHGIQQGLRNIVAKHVVTALHVFILTRILTLKLLPMILVMMKFRTMMVLDHFWGITSAGTVTINGLHHTLGEIHFNNVNIVTRRFLHITRYML